MTEPIIRCNGLSHVYKGMVLALDQIELQVHEGEILGIIGQNGSGKTTLVKHLNGLLKPTSGTVTVDGMDTRKVTVNTLSRTVGYVFQNPNHQLFANSVNAEISFGPSNLGLGAAEANQRIEEAVQFFDLQVFRTIHPYRLSFPIRKMVCMAAVFAMRPKVMVLDEPTTGQDHAGVDRVHELIRKLQESHTTVIMVSHDMRLEAAVADRIVVLRDGRILAEGSPRQVFAQAEILKSTNLQAPQVAQLGQRIGLGLTLTVPEFIQQYTNWRPVSEAEDHGE